MLSLSRSTFVLLGLCACSSPIANTDASSSDSISDTSESRDAADDVSDGGGEVALAGRVVFDKYNGQPNIPARNRQIGIVDGASTMTDESGSYALTSRSGVDAIVLASMPGEISVQRALAVSPMIEPIDLHVIDIDAYVGAVNRLMGEIDAFSFGMVVVRFRGATRGGYTAMISATHGGSFVFDPPDTFGNPIATDTTRVADDSVYFYAVAPGTATLTLTSPSDAAPCVDPHAPSTGSYPVTAGTFTEIVLRCP